MFTNLDLGTYLLQKEVADLLGISPQAVSKILRENNIPTDEKGSRLLVVPPRSFEKLKSLRKLPPINRRIAVHIVKGGVGKTTLTHGLSARASSFGLKTLIVDLDQQGNLSHSFGIWPKVGEDPTLLNVYQGDFKGQAISVRDTITAITDFLHIVPANLTLANLDSALLMGNDNLGSIFSDMLAEVENDYDLILLDCPPALSKVTAAVHCYVDTIVMPVNADIFSIEGLQLTLDHLKNLKKSFKVDPKISIVLNKCHAQHKMTFEVLNALHENYSEWLSDCFISSAKKIENSIANGQCIWADRTKNNALSDMHNYLCELLGLAVWKQKQTKRTADEATL